jgi:cold shock protein
MIRSLTVLVTKRNLIEGLMMIETGTVKFFDERGYGFIQPSKGGEDLYFHASELPGKRGERTISDGQPVSYELGTRNGKPVARKVASLAADEQEVSNQPAVRN